VPLDVAFVVVDGLAPRGAIVLSLGDGAPVEFVVAAPGADVSAAGAVVDDGIEGVVAVVDEPVVVDVSAAPAAPMPDRPIADAISAYAILPFSLRIMSAPRRRSQRQSAAGTPLLMQGACLSQVVDPPVLTRSHAPM
jgi:hypothetical protein